MTSKTYGIYCEDDPMRLFVHSYIERLNIKEFQNFSFELKPNPSFQSAIGNKNNSKTEVKKKFLTMLKIAQSQYNIDLMFIGVDCDGFEDKKFNENLAFFRDKIEEARIDIRTIIFIPVQCIEHWLWYLKMKQENDPKANTKKLEKEPKPKAKLKIYQDAKGAIKRNRIVSKILENWDPEFLDSHSKSFRHFREQIDDLFKI